MCDCYICQARSKQTLFGQAMISAFSGVCALHTHLSRGVWGHEPPGIFLKSTPLKTLFMGFSAKFNFRILSGKTNNVYTKET